MEENNDKPSDMKTDDDVPQPIEEDTPQTTEMVVDPPTDVAVSQQSNVAAPHQNTAATSQASSTAPPQASSTVPPQASSTVPPQASSTPATQASNAATPQASCNTTTPQPSNTAAPQPSNTATPQPKNAATTQPSNGATPQTEVGATSLPIDAATPQANSVVPQINIQVIQPDDEPDPALLEQLLSMGMGKRLSKKALICTKNRSADAALAWIADLGAEEMEVLVDNSDDGESEASDEWEDCTDEEDEMYYKMVFVINMELSMGVGKVASQVGHAALGLYRLLLEDRDKYEASTEEWEEFGERKIALKAKNAQELIELQKKAESLHLPTYLVQDAGKTQIPIGSTTVLAIFGDEEGVNEVTGKLKLL